MNKLEEYKKRKVFPTRISYYDIYHQPTEEEKEKIKKTIKFLKEFDFQSKKGDDGDEE